MRRSASTCSGYTFPTAASARSNDVVVVADVDDDAVGAEQHELPVAVDGQHDPPAAEHRRQPSELLGVVGDLTLVAHGSFLLWTARLTTGTIPAPWR